jgi:diguanylate cyclase (GGDEF)-like protein/PAS domain S-box-containing protein
MSDDSLYQSILDSLFDGVYLVDPQRRISYWNKGAEKISGFSASEVTGRWCGDGLLVHVDGEGTLLCGERCPLKQTIHDGQTREVQIYLRHAAGHRVPVIVRATPIRNAEGEIVGAAEVFRDNTALSDAVSRAEALSKQALLDPLTSLGNRAYIEAEIRRCLIEVGSGSRAGVLFVDIDHFKDVNDSHGHDAGDLALKVVAKTLQHSLRSTDRLGRWGGDEFLVAAAHTDIHGLSALAGKLRALVEASRVQARPVGFGVTVSVGATLLRPDDTLETVLKRTDTLLYHSKNAGRNVTSVEP